MRRSDIYSVRMPKGKGREQPGKRFGVVVQSDAFLPRSVVLIAPTSTSARPASFQPEVEIEGTTTKVLVKQLGAVDITHLGEKRDVWSERPMLRMAKMRIRGVHVRPTPNRDANPTRVIYELAGARFHPVRNDKG